MYVNKIQTKKCIWGFFSWDYCSSSIFEIKLHMREREKKKKNNIHILAFSTPVCLGFSFLLLVLFAVISMRRISLCRRSICSSQRRNRRLVRRYSRTFIDMIYLLFLLLISGYVIRKKKVL